MHGVFGWTARRGRSGWSTPTAPEREIALEMLPARSAAAQPCSATRTTASPFVADVTALGATLVRPRRKDEPQTAPGLSMLPQRVASIFWTCKDLLTLERHGARTLPDLRARILQRLRALTASISLNHHLGPPCRGLVDFVA